MGVPGQRDFFCIKPLNDNFAKYLALSDFDERKLVC